MTGLPRTAPRTLAAALGVLCAVVIFALFVFTANWTQVLTPPTYAQMPSVASNALHTVSGILGSVESRGKPEGGAEEGTDGGFHQVSDRELFLYSGFVDARFSEPVVRLFGLRSHDITSNLTCSYAGHGPSSHSEHYAIYPEWPSIRLKYLAYEFQCGIPRSLVEGLDPPSQVEVSLSLGSSEATSPMRVRVVGRSPKPRQTLAICVKGIWGPVHHVRLVEWIEFNKYLGVEKIIFYDVLTLGRARKVLAHYEREGLVDVITFSYTQKISIASQNDPEKRQLTDDSMWLEQSFLVALNDCYYRYRDRFANVLVLDIDEIIIPATNQSLLQLTKEADEYHPQAAAHLFRNAYHMGEFGEYTNSSTEVPYYLHMHRYLRRTATMPQQAKAIISTDRSLAINWHSSVRQPPGQSGNYFLPWEQFGFVHHYRKICRPKYSLKKCMELRKSLVVDTVVLKYRTVVGKMVADKLHALFCDSI